MTRGRRVNLEAKPTRQLETQRAFRRRRADLLASLEEKVAILEAENASLRSLKDQKLMESILGTDYPSQSSRASADSNVPTNSSYHNCAHQRQHLVEQRDNIRASVETILSASSTLSNSLALLSDIVSSQPHSQSRKEEPSTNTTCSNEETKLFHPFSFDAIQPYYSREDSFNTQRSQEEQSEPFTPLVATSISQLGQTSISTAQNSSQSLRNDGESSMVSTVKAWPQWDGQRPSSAVHGECCLSMPGCIPSQHCPFQGSNVPR